eukprot:2620811-Pyramimonas_sp.AAC.1
MAQQARGRQRASGDGRCSSTSRCPQERRGLGAGRQRGASGKIEESPRRIGGHVSLSPPEP